MGDPDRAARRRRREEDMVTLPHDPSRGDGFWSALMEIPGYPEGGPERLIDTMVFESGALFELPVVLRRACGGQARPLLVVMDGTPMRRGPESLKPLAIRTLENAGWEPEALVLEPDGDGHVRTDWRQIRAVEARLRPDSAVVSLGSGTVSDIVKHACHGFERKGASPALRIPFVAVPTANSNGACTSNVATVFVSGVKRSLDSRLPDAIVYDLETLRDAPYDMTAAGAGEMLVGVVTFPDWIVAHRLGMDPSYTPFHQTLMAPNEGVFVDHAALIRERTLEGMALEAKLIALAGIGGSLIHASTHLSGYEHVISHLIDQQSRLAGRPPALHGAQVMLATVLVCEAYRLFLSEFDPAKVRPERCYPAESEMSARVEEAFRTLDPSGETAAECWSDYRMKLERWHANGGAFSRFLAEWRGIRRAIERFLRPPEWFSRVLVELGFPLGFEELDPPVEEARVRFAFLNAPFTRRRLTLGDLLVFLGWDREALWERASRSMKAVVAEARRMRASRPAAS